jgi:hypothetical protein
LFERRGRQVGIAKKKISAVGIEPEVSSDLGGNKVRQTSPTAH